MPAMSAPDPTPPTASPRMDWYHRLVQLWRFFWAKGPCHYCGKPTRSRDFSGEFRHRLCWEADYAIRCLEEKRQAESRRQINLYKQAIREIEAEKQNTMLGN